MSIDLQEIELYQKLIGLKVKELRVARNMSQNDLAFLCELDKQSISRIERGKTNITLKTSLILSKAFNVKIYDFYNIDVK
ncbi:helix-turn-helix transcriptional regulator [Flavobacterium terrigena]|nr:helix-turn-helix transcriptional regulator [Flavobacterium terrigena]